MYTVNGSYLKQIVYSSSINCGNKSFYELFMNCFLIQIKCGQKRKSCIDIQFAHLKLTDGAGIGIGIGTNCRMTQNSLVTADPE